MAALPDIDVDLPVEDPILIFALAMVIFLIAPLVLERYRLPGIVGIILVGATIGPNGIGLLARDATFILLGEVGLVYLMFLAGLEINYHRFVEHADRSIVFGLLSFLIPQLIGTAVGLAVLDLTVPAALLFAAIFSSHTLLAYPIINRLGIANNEAMTVTIGGTIITDTLALLVLVIVVAGAGGELDFFFWVQLGIGLAVLFGGIWLLVPRIARWFFRSINQESYFDFLFVMVVLFTAAYLGELLGVKHIIGAFLAGLALNRWIPETGSLMNRIEFVGNALFIPFFLLSVGMLVDIWVLREGIETIEIVVSLLALVVMTKFVAAWLTGRMYAYSWNEIVGMYGLSLGQAAAALAIVLIGFEAGIPGFDEHMINGTVLMILAISLVSPTLVERAGQGLRRAKPPVDFDPSDDPRRILVPFSRASRYRNELLDFAVLLRGGDTDEPVYTVSVVQPGEDIESEVRVVESALTDAEVFAAGAEVPVESRVQVDNNPASGIVRAILENRISILVLGWDGSRSRRQAVFGTTIDQVIRRTDRLIVVARVREPIEPTQRIVLFLPSGVEHSPGFAEMIHSVKLIADGTGARVHGLLLKGDSAQFDRMIRSIDPDVPLTWEMIDDWQGVYRYLRDDIRPDDIVIGVSARRGAMGWHRELQTLPKRISRLVDGNFVIVYPAAQSRTMDSKFIRID